MNEHAIKKLRRKFITISFISLFSVMLIMGSMIYYVNYITSVRQMDNALNYLVEKGGEVDFDTPVRHWDGASYDSANSSDDNFTEIFMETLRELFNTKINEGSESIFGMRYFAVVFQDEGDTNPITAHINEIDEDSAFAYADEALKQGNEYGWMGNYRYKVDKSDGQTVVVNGTTGIDEAVAEIDLMIRAGKGTLSLTATRAQDVNIHAVNGVNMKRVELEAGESQTVILPAGIYIVNGTKIVVK